MDAHLTHGEHQLGEFAFLWVRLDVDFGVAMLGGLAAIGFPLWEKTKWTLFRFAAALFSLAMSFEAAVLPPRQ